MYAEESERIKGVSRIGKAILLHTNPGTRVEPQQIVAQRLLSCVQYPVLVKSSTEDLTRPTFCFAMKYRVDPKAIRTPTPVEGASSLPAWILS